MNYEKKYKEALNKAKEIYNCADKPNRAAVIAEKLPLIFPELKESEDERIRNHIVNFLINYNNGNYYRPKEKDMASWVAWLEKQKAKEQRVPEENEEPQWLLTFEEDEKEKQEFVGDGFIRCKVDFPPFKEGEHYWLEYVGNNNYNVRSDNLLGQIVHISGSQLYTVFQKLTWLEKQKPVEWSNEDDSFLQDAVNYFNIDDALQHPTKDVINWLKSLKQRIAKQEL